MNQRINESMKQWKQWNNESTNKGTNESMNQWSRDWTSERINEFMDGWMDEWVAPFLGYFVTERPLRWGTSSLSYFFSEQPLIWVAFSLTRFCSELPPSYLSGNSFCNPILSLRAAVTIRLATSSCNPAYQERRNITDALLRAAVPMRFARTD